MGSGNGYWRSCHATNYVDELVCHRCAQLRSNTDFSKDTCDTPSQFLQLHGYKSGTTDKHITTAIHKLLDVRIKQLLMLHGAHDEHVPVAFIEFEDTRMAEDIMKSAMAIPGRGFTIYGTAVKLSFIHGGVFVPEYRETALGVFRSMDSQQLLAYWNPEYQCSQFFPHDQNGEEPSKAVRRDQVFPEAQPRKKIRSSGPVMNNTSGSGSLISHWSKIQAQLNTSETSTTQDIKFVDLDQMTCLLCSRRFKNEKALQQHEKLSDLHRENLKEPALVLKAQRRLNATEKDATVEAVPEIADTIVSNLYRDRALERREQMKKDGHLVQPIKGKQRQTVREPNPPQDSKPQNKGADLLRKLGYKSGGLGVAEQGRKEIVQADVYVPGTGLGSVGGKLTSQEASARQSSNDYASFVASVKETARSRYHNEANP